MTRKVRILRRIAPAALAVTAGVGAGLATAGAMAAPVGAAWRDHVVPAFANLLGTLFFC